MLAFKTPATVNVDAYQSSHFEMIPTGMEDFQLSQGIFRKQLHWGDQMMADSRLLSAGLAPFLALEPGIARPITQEDIAEADDFYSDFNLGTMEFPWPRQMFQDIVEKHNGYFPICIMGLFDGQTHYVGEPHMQIWTDESGMGECVGWIESSVLPYAWTSAAVATRGRNRLEKMIEFYKKAYPSKSLKELKELVSPKFHDFGRRGGAASQITGIAHLINWLGTDTCDAAYAAKKYLNNGKSFGANSIPAGAHRTITTHVSEDAAYAQHIGLFKKYPVIAIVADSYGYDQGINKLAKYAEVVKTANGFLVGRPDSGDPTECVIKGLKVFAKAFGTTKQEIGLDVINNAAIIQGDGVSDRVIFDSILPATMKAGFCPSNVAFGMGEYNHRAVRSDTEEAYKTALVGNGEGGYRESMKSSENYFKRSVPGPVALNCNLLENRVTPITIEQLKAGETGDLKVLFDGRSNPLESHSELFSDTRKRAWESWLRIPPYYGDTFSSELREKQEKYIARMQQSM